MLVFLKVFLNMFLCFSLRNKSMYCNIYSVVIFNETFQFLRNFLLYLHEVELLLSTKNILVCPKSKRRHPFVLHSYCHVRDIFREATKLSQHATFGELRIAFNWFSFLSKSFNYSRVRYKHSFLRY